MIFTNENFNLYMGKYKKYVDEVSLLHNYPSNITHLLYVIVPAFVEKYGFKQEHLILNMFKDTTIIIEDRGDIVYQAAFSRKLKYISDKYKTDKYVFLYNYQRADLMQLLDNLIHEFNHAINSIQNEIRCDQDLVYLRTGLTYLIYDKKTLQPVSKQEDAVLEEIINTKQTEMILSCIASFSQYNVLDTEISNIIFIVQQSILGSYRSGAYYLQATVCQRLLENKTFVHTLENLRLQGEIDDLANWFDMIVGKEGSFEKIESLLAQTLELEKELHKAKWFKKAKMQKIMKLSGELFSIINVFNENCNFK